MPQVEKVFFSIFFHIRDNYLKNKSLKHVLVAAHLRLFFRLLSSVVYGLHAVKLLSVLQELRLQSVQLALVSQTLLLRPSQNKKVY